MKANVNLSATGVLALVGVAVAGYLLWKASGVASKAAGAVGDAAWALTPWNQENVFYGGVNAVGGALVTAPDGMGKTADGGWTLGGWWYDLTHPQTYQAVRDVTQPYASTVIHADEANDARRVFAETDPRRIDIPATSDYGAAFGIYPKP